MNQMSSKRSHTQPIAKRSIAFTLYHNKVKEEDYGVCADCLGFCLVWRHRGISRVKANGEADKRNNTEKPSNVRDSRLILLPFLSKAGDALQRNVLYKMAKDNVIIIAKTDEVILSFGQSRYNKLGKRQAVYISQRMSQLSRLVQQLKIIEKKEICQLKDFMNPENFTSSYWQ